MAATSNTTVNPGGQAQDTYQFSVQNLLKAFKQQGDALVRRMMDLERRALS